MVKSSAFALAILPLVAAFPALLDPSRRSAPLSALKVAKRDVEPVERQPLFTTNRPNTGNPPAGFNAEAQYVDVSPGSGHEFQSPGDDDLRGECPGLNAAANHGFLPRSGVVDIAGTISGLAEAYNMAPDLSIFLAAVSIALSGDPIAGTWSIGGAYNPVIGLTGTPGGITSVHNKYEGDASITRGDAYLNGGLVNAFQMRSWEHLYALTPLTLDRVAAHNDYIQHWSILNNPYYFTGIFAGAVTPAAHNFIVEFFSNRSAENPGGELPGDILASFFSVTGEPGNFVHTYGHERIPENWYKRPALDAYNIPNVFQDLLMNNAMYPGLLRFGGNTGETNTFTGIDLENITGGVFNAENLLEGNNLACFAMQAAVTTTPGLVDGALDFFLGQISPMLADLVCEQLSFEEGKLSQFPGASYKGTGVGK